MCERFCCGPPLVCEPGDESWKTDDFYASDYGFLAFVSGRNEH